MKKALLFLTILTILNSCTKNNVAETKVVKFSIPSGTITGSGNDLDVYVDDAPSGTSNSSRRFNKGVSEITEDVVNNGAVLVYIRSLNGEIFGIPSEANGNSWASLPYTVNTTSYQININFQYSVGLVSIVRRDSDLILGNLDGTHYKVVILDPIEKSILIDNGVDLSNHNEVMSALEMSKK